MQVGISSVLFWMDFESEISVIESVENNEGVDNVSAAGTLGDLDEAEGQNNGSCVEESDGPDGSLSETKGKKSEIWGTGSLPPSVIDRDISPASTKKGSGLKKWRRIKREPNKVGDSSVQTGNLTVGEVLNLGGNSGKRVQVDPERKQRSGGSVSSTNAMLRSSDGFALLDDSGLEMRPPSFSAGTDLGNREDQKSKSSTTESSPRVRGEASPVVGYLHDKRRISSLSGKDLTHSVRRGLQGKGKIDTGKRSKGEKVRMEKENSHSSTESDSRSYNFVFAHGMSYTRNGIRTEKSIDYNEESGDEDQVIEHQLSNGLHDDFHKNGEGGYKDASTEDVGIDSSWEAKDERSQNNDGSSMDMYPLPESIFVLKSVGEMLEKEVLKLSETGKDLSIADLVQDLSFIESVNIDVETEIEDLFKRTIEAEVECIALSRTVQTLRDAIDQVNILEEQRTLLSDTVKKDAVLEKEAKRLETLYEDAASADEMLKLQTRVSNYTSCFFVQLVLLVLVLVIFIFQESPKYTGVVPT